MSNSLRILKHTRQHSYFTHHCISRIFLCLPTEWYWFLASLILPITAKFSSSFVINISFKVFSRLIEICRFFILDLFLIIFLLTVRLTIFCFFPGDYFGRFPVPFAPVLSQAVWSLGWAVVEQGPSAPGLCGITQGLPLVPFLPAPAPLPVPSKAFPWGPQVGQESESSAPSIGCGCPLVEGTPNGVGSGFHSWLGTWASIQVSGTYYLKPHTRPARFITLCAWRSRKPMLWEVKNLAEKHTACQRMLWVSSPVCVTPKPALFPPWYILFVQMNLVLECCLHFLLSPFGLAPSCPT